MKTNMMLAAATAFTTVTSLAIPATKRDGGSISVTPHDIYSSSIGVLGCKINVNNVAYFPSSPSCDGNCIKVSSNGRSVHLLHIDTSGGAYDISYNAWNYLSTGKSATADPTEGGGIPATWESADMSECADIIKPEANGKLAFSAANSMGFVASCGANTWIGQNYALYNIANPDACTLGVDEVCDYNPSVSSQPSCPNSQLGVQTALSGNPVYNIVYGTGKEQLATS